MNPFINLKKRSISLPSGCKELADVLQRSARTNKDSIRQFIHLLLLQAQQAQATELVIRSPSATGYTAVMLKDTGLWFGMPPIPSEQRPAIVAELARMAKLRKGQFPQEGLLDESFGGVRLTWTVRMASAEAECVLVRVQDSNETAA